MALDGWWLNTHPDLVEQLVIVAPQPRDAVPVYGVPVIVADGIAAVVALGTNWLVFRLAEPPVGLRMVAPIPSLKSSDGWHSVASWQPDLSTAESLARLRELTREAMAYASMLASPR
ncbi:hypothetical protein [Frankia sp. R82]|uniref:hypothetical protein n=1 Tax=Frankia sp. R82 TaxID=2950553 RepID=UPI002042E67B|nr:hypothetical protein [Frankia sp. R82]MCM3884071.1 hypothetical protein [Frankia sp. R82]